jgi:3-deoxy-D-arabino-heptulosonate 7-phosphate (DAHP) synthase class II
MKSILKSFRFDVETAKMIEKMAETGSIPEVTLLRLAVHCLAAQLPQLINPVELEPRKVIKKKQKMHMGKGRIIAESAPLDPWDQLEQLPKQS